MCLGANIYYQVWYQLGPGKRIKDQIIRRQDMADSGADRPAHHRRGVAGLVTAYYLGKAGIAVDLFEAEEETGGLARSFEFAGERVDRYYHFVCLPDQT